MAGGNFDRPTELPEWATNDVNLPSTNNPNKVTTPLILRQTGVDYLALPSAEYENYWRNNVWCWTGYLDNQVTSLRTDVTALQAGTDSVVDLNQTYVDIGDLRMVFGEVDMVVGGTVGDSQTATLTLNPTLQGAPRSVQLTNFISDGREGTECIVAVTAATGTTITIEANRVSGTNAGGTEVLRVAVMAVGEKP